MRVFATFRDAERFVFRPKALTALPESLDRFWDCQEIFFAQCFHETPVTIGKNILQAPENKTRLSETSVGAVETRLLVGSPENVQPTIGSGAWCETATCQSENRDEPISSISSTALSMSSGTVIGRTCSFPGTTVTFACGKTCFKNSALLGLTIPSRSL